MAKLDDFLKRADAEHLQWANEAADKFGIPRTTFQSLIAVESSWRPDASATGSSAYGYTQLTKGAAQDVNANPYDVQSNLNGGAAYLASQYKRLGNWEDALSAYNQGYGGYTNADGRAYARKVLGLSETASASNGESAKERFDAEWASIGREVKTGEKPDGTNPSDSGVAGFIKSRIGDISFIILAIVLIAIAILMSKPAATVVAAASDVAG